MAVCLRDALKTKSFGMYRILLRQFHDSVLKNMCVLILKLTYFDLEKDSQVHKAEKRQRNQACCYDVIPVATELDITWIFHQVCSPILSLVTVEFHLKESWKLDANREYNDNNDVFVVRLSSYEWVANSPEIDESIVSLK